MSKYHFISGSNINSPELAFKVCLILFEILNPLYVLLLRFGSAFCLLKTFLAFFLGESLPILKLDCVLSQDFLHFVFRHHAFCLKASFVLPSFEDLLCVLGKENGVNILKSIDEGPFQMGTVREPLAEGTEGVPHLGDKHLTSRVTKDIYTLINHYTDAKDIWDNVKMLLEGLSPMDNLIKNLTNTLALLTQSYKTFLPKTNNQLRTSSNTRNQATVQDGRVVVQNVQGQARQVKCYNCNGIGHIARNFTQPKHLQNFDYFKDKMMLMQAQENGVALDEEQLLFLTGGQDNAIYEDADEQPVQDLALNVDNVFQANDCDAFDSNVDEALTAQTMFMANLSSTDHVYDEAGHRMIQTFYLSNMILYDLYVKDNAMPGVHSNASSVPNDAYMMIYNDMYEPHAQSISKTSRNTVLENSLTAELATYKEQVELYERWAKFELTEREKKINEQLRIVINDRNFKEETLKKDLYYVKLQLASTINHNKLTVEEVMSLKKDFKQKENKYLKDFLDMKSLKEKVAIGYKNLLCLTRAKQVQHALYNGHEIIKYNHVSDIVHNTEDTLEVAEITRRKRNDKMKDPECMNHKVKIAPHDYSKENFLATFTPQKQLTLEQIFWSQYIIKMKTEALKEQTIASIPIKALTVYPPNTHATLVPRVLPTKSQVKIHTFTLIQLFLEFDKTCKKRITPTGLTEGERGFQQTKECYLKEVIPFFKTLKEYFKGIQKDLTKEIKEIKDVFVKLEAEVAQNAIDRKHDEIE
nr:retrovirus-related Pol polyprotein from transposon TNT 1-94 [Tanacetum cinerariifolium]